MTNSTLTSLCIHQQQDNQHLSLANNPPNVISYIVDKNKPLTFTHLPEEKKHFFQYM
jgi:hypothetical protein